MKKQTIILDSSQIDTFLTCPSQWDFGYRQNLTLTDADEKEAIAAGTFGHKWLEIYYTNRMLNKKASESASLANSFDPDKADEPDNHQYPLSKEMRHQVLQRMQEYWMTYLADDYLPDYKHKYEIHIVNDLPVDCYTKIPLIEQGFSHKLFDSPEYLFILEGRIDMLTSRANNQLFMDHKFQLRERKLYPKSIQFKNYGLVTGCNFGIINYIRLHKEVKTSTLVREPISFSAMELRRWRAELIGIYVDMAKEINNSLGFTHRWNACSGKFGYPCQFTHICEEPNPHTANLIKVQKYKEKKEWKPW